jgi:rhomboid protease GluP
MTSATSASDGSNASVVPAIWAVARTTDKRQLNGWLLALEARGIPTLLRPVDDSIALCVPWMHADTARAELAGVDADEHERSRIAAAAAHVQDDRDRSSLTIAGAAAIALALLAMYLVTGPSAERSPWFTAGSSDASRVVAGEWWRSITALTLHADSNHVLSNIALGSVVITFVMRRTGVGLGVALVVVAGAAGNLMNAWGYGTHHNSIGFSTAVFAAIGILGGLTYVESGHGRVAGRSRPAWVAIAGTLALLAMLGASERSDMLAHVFGMVAGLGVGIAVGLARWRPRAWPGQMIAGVGTAALVAGAWVAALSAAS